MNNILIVKNITKRYRNGSGIHNVHFAVNQGEIVGLLGANGAGKTTTIRCCLGLLGPDTGSVTVGELPAGSPEALKSIAFIPDNPNLYPLLTVQEHLYFRAKAFDLKGDIKTLVEAALQEVGLFEFATCIGGELSRGQRQRVILAGAVLQNASLYVLDEPTAGLDPVSIQWLIDWLKVKAQQGAGVLVSTHNLDFLCKVATRVVVLSQGQVIREDMVPTEEEKFQHWQEQIVNLLKGERKDD